LDCSFLSCVVKLPLEKMRRRRSARVNAASRTLARGAWTSSSLSENTLLYWLFLTVFHFSPYRAETLSPAPYDAIITKTHIPRKGDFEEIEKNF